MFGIDISQHNGAIDWDKLKDNVDFVILRLGWIGNKNNHTLDKKFEQYYNEATRVGIPIGIYVYLYNNNENSAKDGAEWAVKHLQGKTIQMPVYADMEDSSIANLGKTKLTAITKAFNDVIEANGYWAGVYANRNWFDNYLDKSLRGRYTCWIAHYTNEVDKYKGEYDMWQSGSNGTVNGVSGRVDINHLYRPELLNCYSQPQPTNIYKNGNASQKVYADSEFKTEIGSLDKNEECRLVDTVNGVKMVLYKVNRTNAYKVGFIRS